MFGGNNWFAEEESDRNVYSGEFTSIKINSYSHPLLLYQYRIETYLMIHQFLARTRNSIPVSEFSDYVLEMTQEDERSISHLVREFSVKFCLLAILSYLCLIYVILEYSEFQVPQLHLTLWLVSLTT